MNSLYTDKRNYFNLKLNLLHSYNKDIRKQRIQEVENETPKEVVINPEDILQLHNTFYNSYKSCNNKMVIRERNCPLQDFEAFLKKFKKQNRKYRKCKINNWNDRKLRTAFLHITSWEQYYNNTNVTANSVTASKKKVVFIN